MSPAVWGGLVGPDANLPAVVSELGTSVRFADGTTRLDANAGLWNVSLGAGHPRVVSALADSLATASYGGVFRRTSSMAEESAQRLLALWPEGTFDRVLFSTSGSACVDLAIKLARARRRLQRSESHIAAGLKGSYHGQTLGALGVSGEQLGQRLAGVDPRAFRHLDFNDLDRTRSDLERLGPDLAVVFVEPVQGSGTVPVSDDFLRLLDAARERHGFLIVADEIATGFGRTGPLFASAAWPMRPDLVLLSKALTNGTNAASLCLVAPNVTSAFREAGRPFLHGETQAGSIFACAAMLAVVDVFEHEYGVTCAEDFVPGTDRLEGVLRQVADATEFFSQPRGKGSFWTLPFSVGLLDGQKAADLVQPVRDEVFRAGIIVNGAPDGLQFAPAHIFSQGEYDRLADTLAAVAGTFHSEFARV